MTNSSKIHQNADKNHYLLGALWLEEEMINNSLGLDLWHETNIIIIFQHFIIFGYSYYYFRHISEVLQY